MHPFSTPWSTLPSMSLTWTAAGEASEQLTAMAHRWQSEGLYAVAAHARGAVLVAAGDAGEAVTGLREAVRRWQELEAPYACARSRMLLAQAYSALGDHGAATRELDVAERTLTGLDAVVDLRRLERLRPGAKLPGGLTMREAEILRQVTYGGTNKQVADALVISEKTVARHLANIYSSSVSRPGPRPSPGRATPGCSEQPVEPAGCIHIGARSVRRGCTFRRKRRPQCCFLGSTTPGPSRPRTVRSNHDHHPEHHPNHRADHPRRPRRPTSTSPGWRSSPARCCRSSPTRQRRCRSASGTALASSTDWPACRRRPPRQVADATGLQERYVREWLAAMLVGGIVRARPHDGYVVPAARARRGAHPAGGEGQPRQARPADRPDGQCRAAGRHLLP